MHDGHQHGSHKDHNSQAVPNPHVGHEANGAGHAAGHGAQHPPGMGSHPETFAGATWNATILGLLVVLFGLWLFVRRRTGGWRRGAPTLVVGLLMAGLAVASPLVSSFVSGSHLAYMVQLELLMTVSPVLLTLGVLQARGLPQSFVSRSAGVAAPGLGAWLLVLYGSHLPAVHGLVIGSAAAYAGLLFLFLLAGLLFWLPILASEGMRPMDKILYLALAQAGAGVLAAVLIWYPVPIYDHGAPPFGLTAHADQQLSGATMMVVDMLVAATVAGWILVRELAPGPAGSEVGGAPWRNT